MLLPFRLVASDIDGTLIRGDGSLAPRTVSAIDRLHARGVPVVLVTGRPVRWLHQHYEQMDEPVPAICANGAIVYDPNTDAVLRADPLDVDLLRDVTTKLRETIPGITFAVEIEDGRGFRYEEAWPVRWEAGQDSVRVLTTAEGLTSAPAVKLLARSATMDPGAFYGLVRDTLGPIAEITHSSSSALAEISAAGVTKAAGLAWLCERDGYTAADVVAFGDMPNDVPLLSWAGHSVAMGNAHPAVREVADEVTLTNDEDGVAVYLEKLFDL
jgi:Cof subfamily protein (haloacid dehalogenase superfamily)